MEAQGGGWLTSISDRRNPVVEVFKTDHAEPTGIQVFC